jgi:hypothetical protein
MASFNIMKFVLLFSILFALFASTNAHVEYLPRHDEDVYARDGAGATTTTAAPAPAATLAQRPQANAFNFNLTFSLPRASTTLKPLDNVPAACTSYQPGECKATMQATNVTFDDCGDSWTICRCSDAQMSLDDTVDRFARVPTGLRRYVGTVVVLGDQSPHAYTLTTGDIHLFNDCQMETFLHEVCFVPVFHVRITDWFSFSPLMHSTSLPVTAYLAAQAGPMPSTRTAVCPITMPKPTPQRHVTIIFSSAMTLN